MSILDRLDPAVAGPLGELIDGIWDGRVDPALLEPCRRRICEMLGAPPDTAIHPTTATLTLDHEPDGRSQACLAFTEQWMLDPHAMTDELATAVTRHLSPAQCAGFTIALATIEAQVRAETTLAGLR